MNSPSGIPELYKEQSFLGELDSLGEQRVSSLSEEEHEEQNEKIQKSNDEILQNYPAHEVSSQLFSKLSEPQKLGSSFWKMSIAGAVMGMLCLMVWVSTDINIERPSKETIYFKGDRAPVLKIYKQQEEGGLRLKNNAMAKAGDILQLSYVAKGFQYGMIFSVDGNKEVTLHYPAKVSAKPVLQVSGEQRLSFAYQLDDAPVYERFFFITSKEVFKVAEVLEVVQEAVKEINFEQVERLPLNDKRVQSSILIRKGGYEN